MDFTGDYRTRLADLDPVLLGLDQQATAELAELIDAVETGKYHAEDEKRALKKFVAAIQLGTTEGNGVSRTGRQCHWHLRTR